MIWIQRRKLNVLDVYRVGQKSKLLYVGGQLWEIRTDFNNSFTFGFTDKLRNTVK